MSGAHVTGSEDGMNQRVKDLSLAARQLPADELSELVDDLLVALHQADPEWNKVWAAEADRRIEAYNAGRMKAVPAAEVLRRLGKP
jgi:putative addiction module component (TIGR02574 family)